jgi:hypothetical protein
MGRTRKPVGPSAEDALAANEQAFQRQRAELLRRYEGEYVALRAGRVVAHGPDDEELARRLFADSGDQPFYIAKVEQTPTIHELPSPELEP